LTANSTSPLDDRHPRMHSACGDGSRGYLERKRWITWIGLEQEAALSNVTRSRSRHMHRSCNEKDMTFRVSAEQLEKGTNLQH